MVFFGFPQGLTRASTSGRRIKGCENPNPRKLKGRRVLGPPKSAGPSLCLLGPRPGILPDGSSWTPKLEVNLSVLPTPHTQHASSPVIPHPGLASLRPLPPAPATLATWLPAVKPWLWTPHHHKEEIHTPGRDLTRPRRSCSPSGLQSPRFALGAEQPSGPSIQMLSPAGLSEAVLSVPTLFLPLPLAGPG